MKWRIIVLLVVVAAVVAGGWAFLSHRDREAAPVYATARLERGELVESVRASGTIRPLNLVQVGTQISGPVSKLLVNFNDRVTAGQVVAQIDPSAYEARAEQDQATVLQSEASVDESRARLIQAEQELGRAQELLKHELIPQSELDAAQVNRDVAAAQLKVSQARLAQSLATLRMSRTNLGYATIRSPVDGVVIDRKVDEGQTVVASMSAQTIFVVAKDLSTVQVEASIPEADIGRIRAGQIVTFNVDAFPDSFTGKVEQVRLSGTSVQNVVTYPVIIHAPNPDGRLLPGMTANITCEVARRDHVLKVPNAALRYRPEVPKTGERSTKGDGGPSVFGSKLWLLPKSGEEPESVPVTSGITDGSFTEIGEPSPVAEGQEVVTGVAQSGALRGEKVNPFAPSIPPRGVRRVR